MSGSLDRLFGDVEEPTDAELRAIEDEELGDCAICEQHPATTRASNGVGGPSFPFCAACLAACQPFAVEDP